MLLLIVFETAMEKFSNDFSLGLDLLNLCRDFDASWAQKVSETLLNTLKTIATSSTLHKLKLEWTYNRLYDPSKIKTSAIYQKSLTSCEEYLFPKGQVTESDSHSVNRQELYKEWLKLWTSQRNLSHFYADPKHLDYKKLAEIHFEKLADLQQVTDLLSTDERFASGRIFILLFETDPRLDLELVITRLNFETKSMKKLLRRIQALKTGLPASMLSSKDGVSAILSGKRATDFATIRKTLNEEGARLKPQASLHMLQTLVANDKSIWNNVTSAKVVELIKLAVKCLHKSMPQLEELLLSVLQGMKKHLNNKESNEEFELDVYEEMTNLGNMCPATVFHACVNYLVKNNIATS